MADHEKGHDDHEKGHKKGHGGGHGHGGGGHEEHAGAPEWLISFADNVALLMGFFVILLAMNMAKPKTGGFGGDEKFPSNVEVDNPAMMDFVIAMRAAMNNPISPTGTNPEEAGARRRMLQKKQESPDGTRNNVNGTKTDTQAIERGKILGINGTVPFDQQSAVINSEARDTIAGAAKILKGTRWIVEIRGHVSAVEAHTGVENAMRLSYNRATAVAGALAEAGVPWKHMRVVACSDNERIEGKAYTETANRTNQRVEIVVSYDVVPGDPHMLEPGREGGGSGGGGGSASGGGH